ncbi:hypothetical protein GUY44_02385 [Pimelobacter simplex]|uniref:Uncharacterized protein n=1 Tax=Nocardioides simplex TaxID=2045 RepID=A0A0A1DRN4_NOCSI|nr:hypothetical protein [Pimelobacter simplex]AIY19238.1 hypothetical protein KR76_25125 [Pimelobacter simplex]MCG8149311.1 hypothetical protein [Pimelobacter simplex]GEB16558.1 hypothetical protein NSI01_48730 [Pimelobacter simplex]SFM20666.1 hypothetical protein SAMN05421671_0305 [Pimelobacter simplex]
MKSRLRLGAGVALTMLVSTGLVSNLPGDGAASARTSAAATAGAADELLVGTFGAAGSFDRVTVIAQQVDDAAEIGDILAQYEVPAALTVAGDRYSVSVRPSDVPRGAIDAGGVVDLELQFSSSRDTWMTYLSVRLVRNEATGALAWIDPVESLPQEPS